MPAPQLLTPLFIRRIKPPPDGRDEYPDTMTRGLVLRVSAKGRKSWTFRTRDAQGCQQRYTLGDMTEEQGISWARKEADRHRQQVLRDGRNLHEERREKKAAKKAEAARERLTLETLIDDWTKDHLVTKSAKYRSEAPRALKLAFEAHLAKPADTFDRSIVVEGLKQLASPEAAKSRKKRGITADRRAIVTRTAAYGKACFNWAIKRGVLTSNPFVNLPLPDAPASRERVLTDSELAAVWIAAGTDSYPFGQLIRMLILTGQREQEVGGMRWSELSDDNKVWTIPASRTKNKKRHIVPLSEPAGAILAARREAIREETNTGSASKADELLDFVFPGRFGQQFNGWSKGKRRLDAASGVQGWRIHDLRRTVATGMQRLKVQMQVTEAALNHISGSRAGIVGVYQVHDYADEKRQAFDVWASLVCQIVSQPNLLQPSRVALKSSLD